MSDDKFWDEVSERVRKARGLRPLSPEEAKKAYKEAPEAPLPAGEIEAIVSGVTSGRPERREKEPDAASVYLEAMEEVEDDVCVFNRNRGEDDPETDELLDELRRKALSDDDGEEEEKDN